jgi:hypothetical protein
VLVELVVVQAAAAARHADRRRLEHRARRRHGHRRAAQQLHAQLAGLGEGPHHAVDPVAIGQPQRRQPESLRRLDQLVGVARTLEKREVAAAPQRGVGGHEREASLA